jgi:hypothetical protein
MRRSMLFTAVLVGLGAVSSVARAHTEDFHIVDHSVVVDDVAKTATFRLSFDREPRFFLPHGGGGGQPNAFQYEIDVDTATRGPIAWDGIDTVVRGGEIFAGSEIPIRDRDGDGGSNAGGFGPVRAAVPFDLDGSTLTFTAALSDLGDEGDGHFKYRLITTENGGLTGEVQGAVIPLPAAVWSGMMMLGGLGIVRKIRGRKARMTKSE